MEGEEGRVAAEDIGEARGGDTADEDRHQRRHRQVNHQHFQRKHESGDGCLEDAGNGTSRSTSHQEHQRATVQAEHFS